MSKNRQERLILARSDLDKALWKHWDNKATLGSSPKLIDFSMSPKLSTFILHETKQDHFSPVSKKLLGKKGETTSNLGCVGTLQECFFTYLLIKAKSKLSNYSF